MSARCCCCSSRATRSSARRPRGVRLREWLPHRPCVARFVWRSSLAWRCDLGALGCARSDYCSRSPRVEAGKLACYRYQRLVSGGWRGRSSGGLPRGRAVGRGARSAPVASAEDGYDLWLRYRPIEQPWATRYRAALTQLVAGQCIAHATGGTRRATTRAARDCCGVPARLMACVADGALVVGTRRSCRCWRS